MDIVGTMAQFMHLLSDLQEAVKNKDYRAV